MNPYSIKCLRLKLGLTQEQFARKLGVTFVTINRWENKVTSPSPMAREKIEKLMKEAK